MPNGRQDLKENAASAGMRVSAFIIYRLAAADSDADDTRITDTLARIGRSLACLEEIERLRLADDPDPWKAVDERVEEARSGRPSRPMRCF